MSPSVELSTPFKRINHLHAKRCPVPLFGGAYFPAFMKSDCAVMKYHVSSVMSDKAIPYTPGR